MDILKLNKLLVVLILLFFGCDDSKEKAAQANLCNQDSVMHYRHREMSVYLTREGKDKVKKIDIYHIRNGETLAKLEHTALKDDEIELTTLPELHTNDSLKFVLNDSKVIYVSKFKNHPSYGGKNFLGCYFFYYSVDGEEDVLTDWFTMWIRVDSDFSK